MWEIIKTSLPQLLAAGFKYTIPLAIISFFFGLIIALVTALIRLSRQRGAFMILKWIASFYVWLFGQHRCWFNYLLYSLDCHI